MKKFDKTNITTSICQPKHPFVILNLFQDLYVEAWMLKRIQHDKSKSALSSWTPKARSRMYLSTLIFLTCFAFNHSCSAYNITNYTLQQAQEIITQYFQKQIQKARLPIEQDSKKYNEKLMLTNKILIEHLDNATQSIDELKLRTIKKDLKKALMLEFEKKYQAYKYRKDVYLSGLAYKQELKRLMRYIKDEIKLFIDVSLDVHDESKSKFLWQAAKYNIALPLLNEAITPDEVSKLLIIDKTTISEIIQSCKEYLSSNKDNLLQIQAKFAFFKTPKKNLENPKQKVKKTKRDLQRKKIAPKMKQELPQSTENKPTKPKVYPGGGAGPSIRRTAEYYREKAAAKIKPHKRREIEIGQLIDWEEHSTAEELDGIAHIIP